MTTALLLVGEVVFLAALSFFAGYWFSSRVSR